MSAGGARQIGLGTSLGVLFAVMACWAVSAACSVKVTVTAWCLLSVLIWITAVVWLRFASSSYWAAWRERRRQRRDFARARIYGRGCDRADLAQGELVIALVCSVGVLALIAGMLIGVHWYDSKYRPEIDRYLKDCRHER